ncbi:hypothetical protein GETHPA_09300 [Geothrix rubra]|uniref:Secreted protein n=1 Tax=Geothrix rubra TaxID=2927977 RepID=A0ABQ5Q3S8_9BACT|nr:hypothetical protein [Geothrix rubra]GLH69397.1 hypothetical protein GETHPA_09300 [Geothrix rubra]
MSKSKSAFTHFMLITASTISLAAQTGKILNQPIPFSFQANTCPDYGQIPGKNMIEKAVTEYKRKLTGCEATSETFQVDANSSIELVRFTYSFRESDYTERHQFSCLVQRPSNLMLWHDFVSSPDNSLESVRVLHSEKRTILEMKFFTGGTAGFWEEYLEYSNGKLKPIRESFVSEIKPHIPEGFSIRRVVVDIEALTAIIHLASRTDPNCCPSGQLNVTLTLKDDDLHLVNSTFSRSSK